jgi:hypothetical protein
MLFMKSMSINFNVSFVLLIDKASGFKKKGGLFSEYSDKINFLYKHHNENQLNSSTIKNDINRRKYTNYLNTSKNLSQTDIINSSINKPYIKISSSPTMDKAKRVIEQRNLHKIKFYLENNGIFKK